jgi:hypothetical protein
MKRLRDVDARGSAREQNSESDRAAERRARELLQAVDPLPVSRARMTRVWRALELQSVKPARPRRRTMLLLAATFVLASGALAAAQGVDAIRAMIAIVSSAPPPAPETAVKPRPRSRAVPVTVKAPPENIAAMAAHEPSAAEPERPKPSDPQLPAREVTQRTTDAELVRLAVIALRRDGDAERAARLLDQAYAGSARGVLAEEVMALRVEAALMRRDARAEHYAKQYLARYPSGRYRSAVAKALAQD